MNLKILWHWTCGIEFSCVLSPWVPFLNILFLSAFIMTVSILTFQTWDGWIALPTQWTWVWANSGKWWRTGKPGVLQSMGSQRVCAEASECVLRCSSAISSISNPKFSLWENKEQKKEKRIVKRKYVMRKKRSEYWSESLNLAKFPYSSLQY